MSCTRKTKEIICTSSNYEEFSKDSKLYEQGYSGYVNQTYTDSTLNVVKLSFAVKPDNAKFDIDYEMDESDSYSFQRFTNNSIHIYFTKPAQASLTVKDKNTNKQIKIMIYVTKSSSPVI